MVKLHRCYTYYCRLIYWLTTRYPQRALDIEWIMDTNWWKVKSQTETHCAKSFQIWRFSGPYFPVFGPEKTPYLETFHAASDDVTATLRRKYSNLNVKNSWNRDKKQWIECRCQESEHAAAKNDCRSLYKIVRDLTVSGPNTSIPIKNKAGKLLLSKEEQNARWVEHLGEVLNQPIPTILLDFDDDINNVTNNADILVNDISGKEIQKGLRALANKKTASAYFIPAELLKWKGDEIVDELTKIASIV